ncbi:PREDICTED: F-box/kelch-repeat protein At4g39560-like [Camelina sativa]|uniref:F-box/kelch-repeat protein At4g39560-like n=1 Tax=Camelina sativa TaxID=90675 RepID=A0ABM0ZBI9_CAMSA|nr:PREDICTED: F-box/kelch-repeat protein At4g39560-like [Camelina sativa]
MDAKVVEQPRQKDGMEKKRKNLIPPSSLSSLPNEILLSCLARISRYHYRSFSLVSKTLRSLISSPELYQSRSWIGNTEPYLYLCQRLPPYDRWFLVDQTIVTNGRIKDDGLSLSPIAPSPSAPSKPSAVAVGFEIYQMGGTINDDKRPSSAVHVFDCRTHTWRDAPNMLVARKRAKSAFIDGKIFVIGGTKDSKSSSMNLAEVYDLNSQTWKPLLSPCDDAKVQLRRGQLYVNSKLKTCEYDSKQGRWKDSPKASLSKGPWCIIENCGIYCPRLANYCGKLVILRELLIPVQPWQGQIPFCQKDKKSIWCEAITEKAIMDGW